MSRTIGIPLRGWLVLVVVVGSVTVTVAMVMGSRSNGMVERRVANLLLDSCVPLLVAAEMSFVKVDCGIHPFVNMLVTLDSG